MEKLISIKNLNTYYGRKKALNNVSFDVYQGEVIGVVGHNGAGKSTLFKSILGINKSISGDIYFFKPSFDLKNDIGYLPEERGLFDKMKVKEQILFFGSLKGCTKEVLTKNMMFWANYFGVKENLEKKLYTLSKGNQQKVQFIIAMVHEPSLLILDEPFSGLDPLNTEIFLKAIQILKEKGTTILYSSHRLDSVEKLSDRIIFLKEGLLIYNNNLEEIKKKYSLVLEVKNKSLDIDFLEKNHFTFNCSNGVFEIFLKSENEAEIIYKSLVEKYSEIFHVRPIAINDIFKDIYGEKSEGAYNNHEE